MKGRQKLGVVSTVQKKKTRRKNQKHEKKRKKKRSFPLTEW